MVAAAATLWPALSVTVTPLNAGSSFSLNASVTLFGAAASAAPADGWARFRNACADMGLAQHAMATRATRTREFISFLRRAAAPANAGTGRRCRSAAGQ